MTTRALTSANVLTEIPDIDGLTVRWPIDGPVAPFGSADRPAVTQPFAYQLNQPNLFLHFGIDLGIVIGTPVLTLDSGTMLSLSESSAPPYGRHVFVWHWWGVTLYAHLSEIRVRSGEWLPKGALVGLSGNTGISTGPHLHVEARLPDNATRFDWLPYVGKVIRKTDREWFMTDLTDKQRAALVKVADAEIAGNVVYLGVKGLLIAETNAYTTMLTAARARTERRIAQLVTVLGLSQEEIAALPEPKYTTLKRLVVDLQERVQEGDE